MTTAVSRPVASVREEPGHGLRWPLVGLQISIRRTLADRGGLAVSIGFYALVVSVLAGLWRIAVAGNGGTIAGYSGVALTWYIATAEAATVSLNARMIEDVGRDIASGAVAAELLRPASVFGVRLVNEFGRVLPRLAACALTGVVVSFVAAGAPPRLLGLLFAAPSLVLAVLCNLAAQHAFAASAFWIRSAGSAWYLYQKMVFLLGGMLIPLETLPTWLQRVAAVLPFRAMTYCPARLASGHVEPVLLLQQCGWLVVLVALAAVVFRAGERRLQVVGG